jgi:eukaryotic-like serine/threonine-protein kinase
MPDRLLDQTLGQRFRLLERIGTGGFATVYKAVDLLNKHTVAVKVQPRPEAELDPERVYDLDRRFEREAELLSTLQGVRYVVQLITSGKSEDGDRWIAMEYVAGRSLRRAVQKIGGKFEAALYLSVAEELISGIRAIHAHRILHRDLCPENVMLVRKTGGGFMLKFLDFGFGKSLLGENGFGTQKSAIMGRPQYLSPEQSRGEPLTAASDVYSLGVVLYEVLTGHVPIEITSMAELASVRRDAPTPLVTYPASLVLPEEMRVLIMACLAKEPSSRPTIDELLECAVEVRRRHKLGENLSTAFSAWELSRTNTIGDAAEHKLLSSESSFGPFNVRYPLGRGTVGEVWACHDRRTGGDVAVRVLPSGDPKARAFALAARVASRFDHPNLMRVYDVDEVDGLIYAAMPHVKGSSLATVIAAGEPVASARFLHIALGLTAAAEHLHARTAGRPHGFIHPRNVLLDGFDTVMLTDFALGKDVRDADPVDAESSRVHYVSPEQVLGRPIDVRSDVYSIGACFYALATGRPPFLGSTMKVLFAHCHHSPAAPAAVTPNLVPRGLSRLIMTALEKDPARRFATVAALRAELDRVFGDPSFEPAPHEGARGWMRALSAR